MGNSLGAVIALGLGTIGLYYLYKKFAGGGFQPPGGISIGGSVAGGAIQGTQFQTAQPNYSTLPTTVPPFNGTTIWNHP